MVIVVWVEEEGRLIRDKRGPRTLVGRKPIELPGTDGGGGERRRRCSGCRCKCESEYERHKGVATGLGCVDPVSVGGGEARGEETLVANGADVPEAVSAFDLTVRGDGIELFVGDVTSDGGRGVSCARDVRGGAIMIELFLVLATFSGSQFIRKSFRGAWNN